MVKRYCEICGSEIKLGDQYFDLVLSCRGEPVLGTPNYNLEPYLENRANFCISCFSEIIFKLRYPPVGDIRWETERNRVCSNKE